MAENSPVGAVFTYYLNEEVKSLKDIRRENEKKPENKGDQVIYPSFVEMRAEDDEEKPKHLFTFRIQNDRIIRILESEPKEGLHRIVWDFRYPPAAPVNLKEPEFDNPFSDPDIEPMVIPGSYKVSHAKHSGRNLTELVSSLNFKIKLLNNATFPAEDKQVLVVFQQDVSELYLMITGTSNTLNELLNKLKHMKVAIREAEGTDPVLLDRVSKLE